MTLEPYIAFYLTEGGAMAVRRLNLEDPAAATAADVGPDCARLLGLGMVQVDFAPPATTTHIRVWLDNGGGLEEVDPALL